MHDPFEAIAKARERSGKLVSVVASHFPLDVPSIGRHDDWNVTGPAFIARSTRLVQSVLELSDEQESAAGVLVRVLHEHVTTFAWLAIDPDNNLPQWVRKDRDERLKADNDMALFGRRLLSPEDKARLEAERDAIPSNWLGLASMAHHADLHWSKHLGALAGDVYGFRGMYVVLYRYFSSLVHGMPESLHRIIGDGGAGVCRVGVAEEMTPSNAFTLAPLVFALGLLVSSETNGFPTGESVFDAFLHSTV